MMWEILVPSRRSGQSVVFSYEHHKKWDDYVKKISGGLTIMRTAKGEWFSSGAYQKEEMIPCRIICNENEINKIIDFTIEHYNQEAVLAYKIASNVILKYKE